jgi:hypothetical protein
VLQSMLRQRELGRTWEDMSLTAEEYTIVIYALERGLLCPDDVFAEDEYRARKLDLARALRDIYIEKRRKLLTQ